MTTAEDQAKTTADCSAANDGALFLPSLGDVRGRCESFIHKADHAFFALSDIVKLFYPDIGAGLFDRLASLAAERYGEESQFTRFVKRVAPFLKCIRQTRNCVQHPKDGQLINVQDFILSADGRIVPPSIEVIHKEASLPAMAVLEFMKQVSADLAKVFEGMIASLCAQNIRAFVGFPITVLSCPQISAKRTTFVSHTAFMMANALCRLRSEWGK